MIAVVGLIAALACLAGRASAQAENGEYIRACYYTNWAQYRPDKGKFYPEDVDTSLCTHLIYAFATMSGNRLKAYEWNDDSEEWMVGMYERFNNLKKKDSKIKTLLAVGGWNFGTAKMTAMLKTKANRDEFIETSIDFLRERNFDGFDLDFEWPGSRGSPPEDKFLYTFLVQEMRAAFEREAKETGLPRLLLTTAVAAGIDKIDAGYEVEKHGKEFDFISIMTYDFFGAWDNVTGIQAPLYRRSEMRDTDYQKNLADAANYWHKLGAPKNKLVIGVGTYGRGFTLKNAANHNIGDEAKGPCNRGTYTREAGILAYYEICTGLVKQGTRVFHPEHQTPYVYHGDQWVGYDDKESLTLKVQWLKDNGFAGWMVWDLDYDDFKGQFCNEGESYPLMKTLNRALIGNIPTVKPPTEGPGGPSTPRPTRPPRSTYPTIPGTTPVRPTGDGSFCSGRADGLYAHEKNCVNFYICAAGKTQMHACNSHSIFDPQLLTCQWPQAVDETYRCEKCDPIYCSWTPPPRS